MVLSQRRMCPIYLLGNGIRYQCSFLCEEGSLVGVFIRLFVGVIFSLSTRCGRGRVCFVVIGKIGALISDQF